MASEAYVLIAVLLMATAYLMYRLHQVLEFRGEMLVTCPETQKPAAVKVATWRAAMPAIVGQRHMELNRCSRWPERHDCGQDCLCQIEADPESHRVWSIASRWYEGKRCVYCGKPIERLSHLDRRPALLDAEKKSVEWDRIPAEKLPDALGGCLPVCWNCHTIETLIREHPDRVFFRPWERGGPLGEYVPKQQDTKSNTSPPAG